MVQQNTSYVSKSNCDVSEQIIDTLTLSQFSQQQKSVSHSSGRGVSYIFHAQARGHHKLTGLYYRTHSSARKAA